MVSVVLISGSPSPSSRSASLLARADALARARGFAVTRLDVCTLPATALVGVDPADPEIAAALAALAAAHGVAVATPVYKAAYTGLLKTFLDLFPDGALRGKVALPIATAGSAAHALALDYALTPVLRSLGASSILAGFFATDAQFTREGDAFVLNAEAAGRYDGAVSMFLAACASLAGKDSPP